MPSPFPLGSLLQELLLPGDTVSLQAKTTQVEASSVSNLKNKTSPEKNSYLTVKRCGRKLQGEAGIESACF